MDNGCRYYKDCFTCPFPECKFVDDVKEPKLSEAEKERIEAEIKERRHQKALVYQRKYYQDHKARLKKYQLDYFYKNHEKCLEQNREYYKKRRKKIEEKI